MMCRPADGIGPMTPIGPYNCKPYNCKFVPIREQQMIDVMDG